MTYSEEQRNLFSVPSNYCLAHCISDDYALGAGIAVEFANRYDMKNKLLQQRDKNPLFFLTGGHCIRIDNVMNLVTKQHYWEKPTYDSITHALNDMKRICIENNITHIAMPAIGCGLDKLAWSHVASIIKHIFNDTDIAILVCLYRPTH